MLKHGQGPDQHSVGFDAVVDAVPLITRSK
jgi:hypothetical protein